MGEANSDLESVVSITENELTFFIIPSTHMWKQDKCGGLEVYDLVKKSIEFKIFSEVFTETLNSLTENESIIVITFRNRECISLPNENFQEHETEKSRSNFINLKMTF